MSYVIIFLCVFPWNPDRKVGCICTIVSKSLAGVGQESTRIVKVINYKSLSEQDLFHDILTSLNCNSYVFRQTLSQDVKQFYSRFELKTSGDPGTNGWGN